MKSFIETILAIFTKIIMIIWGIVSLFLLFVVSIAIYLVFKIQMCLFKRKITKSFQEATSKVNTSNENNNEKFTVKNKQHKDSTYKSKEKFNNYEIKTITRKLRVKDGEFS